MLPDPIHHDAGREWIARVDDGLREFETTAAFREGRLIAEEAQELTWNGIAFRERIAAGENARRAG